ncbi:MAG TPA: GEVED domain-containing protein, partial [Flavipsychrobacter sp.]|nr:GEVED domain-containing protein [Flavipsychrobacter sp.]
MLKKQLVSIIILCLFGNQSAQAQCFTSYAPFDDCASYGDAITSFSMASVTSTSGCGTNGYSYTTFPVRNLTVGTAYTWNTTIISNYNDPEGVAIWVDINNDGQFTSTEMLSNCTPTANFQSGSLTIPTGTLAASNVRMRVRCSYNYTPASTDACTDYTNGWGETEDYLVNIIVPCNNPTVPTLSATNGTVCNGGSTILSIATGTLNDATTWSWYTVSCGGTAAGTGSSLSVSPTTTTTYYARGTGGCVTPGSCGQITINVTDPPSISAQPTASATLCAGDALNLSVTAANGAGYQWYKNSNPIAGAIASTYSIPVTTTGDAGTYYVEVTGNSPCANLQSNNSVITINAPVNITTQPAATSDICDGSALNLSVVASGAAGYQWYKGAAPIAGATSSTYNIPASVPADAGTYSVIVNGQTPCANVNSTNAVVNIIPRPTVTITNNGPSIICNGDNTSIDLTFTGTGPWDFTYTDGTTPTSVAGNTNTTYNLPVSPTTTTTYSVTALNDINCMATGPDMTSTASVTVNYAPAIVSSPNATSACSGVGTTLTVGATGTNLTYQWRMNGNPISDNSIYSGTQTST